MLHEVRESDEVRELGRDEAVAARRGCLRGARLPLWHSVKLYNELQLTFALACGVSRVFLAVELPSAPRLSSYGRNW